jgi:hypothetical protein
MPLVRDGFKEDAPVPHAASKAGKALEFADVSPEWILFHLFECGHDSPVISFWDAIKSFSCGRGEDDGSVLRGRYQVSHNRRVYKQPCPCDTRALP